MAVIRIKEGSLTIEVFNDDDDPKLVASMHLPQENITFDGAVIEAWKLDSAKPPTVPPTHVHVLAKMNPHGQGKSKISKGP